MDEQVMKKSPSQEKYGRVQFSIRLLVLIVFLGWIFIWIMDPTNTCGEKWWPRLQAKTNSIFGGQGAILLVYTFPILFIAILGCIYLHIAKKANGFDMERWEEKLGSALMVGIVGNICLAFLFFPVASGSSVLPLLGLTSESSIKYHIWLGHMAMTLFTAHGICFIIYWALTDQLSKNGAKLGYQMLLES